MCRIINIENEIIMIGMNDGSIESIPVSAIKFNSPQCGDQVKIFKDGSNIIVTRDSNWHPPKKVKSKKPHICSKDSVKESKTDNAKQKKEYISEIDSIKDSYDDNYSNSKHRKKW